ncbi:MAG: transporter, partial [Actinomycetia bacterium]|nr:transporter [Actinomycetes bacterium]
SRIELWDAIRDLVAQGTDVLLTTQYLDEADQLAHREVIIDHGRVIASGTPDELKKQAGRDVVEVHVRHPEDLPRAAEALAGMTDGEPVIDAGTRRVTIGVDGTDELMTALRALEPLGIELDDIGLRRPTLDEVFLTLTGEPIPEEIPA